MGAFVVFGVVVLAGQFAQAMSAVIGHPVQVDSSGGLVALNNPPRGPWEMALNGLVIAVYLLVWRRFRRCPAAEGGPAALTLLLSGLDMRLGSAASVVIGEDTR